MLFPISLLQNRLNVETICGNISLVGVGEGADPYRFDDIRKYPFSVFGAYRNKICTCGAVIKIFKPCWFSFRQFFFLIHFHHQSHYITKSAEKTTSLPKFFCCWQSRTPVSTICKHPYEKAPKRVLFCFKSSFSLDKHRRCAIMSA